MAREPKKKAEYIEAVGRRKSATARVRIFEAKAYGMEVNDRDVAEYFPLVTDQLIAGSALKVEGAPTVTVTAKVLGGGVHAQAEAIRLGVARALLKKDEEMRPALRQAGFLRRDPREKERRKFGLKKARKSKQWSKR